MTPLVNKIMNQFRRTCEAAAAAAGGCLFPRCISACAEFAGVRRTSRSSTNHTTQPLPVYYLLGTAGLATFCPRLRLPVENFAPKEWPS